MICVLGANGQLGLELKRLLKHKSIFVDRSICDLNNIESIRLLFEKFHFSVLINAAAYTKVDKAEVEKESALMINGKAPGILANLCNSKGIKFVHFSTDYVFDGSSELPYTEDSKIAPINFYGKTKAIGEKKVLEANRDALIIRTSWMYSSYGNNFVKTMMKLGNTSEELKVVNDQLGSPTWAHDLAEITTSALGKDLKGIYHYSHEGKCTWYDFALEVKKLTNFKADVSPVSSGEYLTKAKRPKFSLLSKDKIKGVLGINIPVWQESLKQMIQDLVKTP